MNLSDFFQLIDRVTSIVILGGGILAFICRSWIKEWITARFAKAVNNELEEQKHNLNRDLEAYKGSILRELEEFKADVDIRRSIALKTAEIKLDALRTLYSALSRFCNEAATMAVSNNEARIANHEAYKSAYEHYRDSFNAAEVFLPIEIGRPLTAVAHELVRAAVGAQLQQVDPQINEFLKKVNQVQSQIQGEIRRPRDIN